MILKYEKDDHLPPLRTDGSEFSTVNGPFGTVGLGGGYPVVFLMQHTPG